MDFLRRLCGCGEREVAGGLEHESSWDLLYDLQTLQLATNFFSDANQLGRGGFGPVYKVILSFIHSQFSCITFTFITTELLTHCLVI